MTNEPGLSSSAVEELASDYGAYVKFDVESEVNFLLINIRKNNCRIYKITDDRIRENFIVRFCFKIKKFCYGN